MSTAYLHDTGSYGSDPGSTLVDWFSWPETVAIPNDAVAAIVHVQLTHLSFGDMNTDFIETAWRPVLTSGAGTRNGITRRKHIQAAGVAPNVFGIDNLNVVALQGTTATLKIQACTAVGEGQIETADNGQSDLVAYIEFLTVAPS